MTCRECELLLAEENSTPDVRAHLDACVQCRALAAELTANAAALREFQDELVPAVPAARVTARSVGWARWAWAGWAVPIAAALVLAALLFPWGASPRVKAPEAVVTSTPAALPAQAPPLKQQAALRPAPLKIKMLTADPDVVIYWLIDSNEGD